MVVNKWASWCGPCRFEFPFFQKLVDEAWQAGGVRGRRRRGLEGRGAPVPSKFPIPYPSFFDPHSDIAAVFHGDRAFPTTVYYDRKGAIEYVKQGGYASEDALARDIARYAR